jgi:hypothetical protein
VQLGGRFNRKLVTAQTADRHVKNPELEPAVRTNPENA